MLSETPVEQTGNFNIPNILFLISIAFTCAIESIVAGTVFSNKRKIWIVAYTTAFTNLFLNTCTRIEFYHSEQILGFINIILITLCFETIVVFIEWFIYKTTKCCKHAFLFSLDANMTSFSIGTLIQLLILMPKLAYADIVTYEYFSAADIATGDSWVSLFMTRPILYWLSVAACAAMLISGIILMLWLRNAEKTTSRR